ncbi:MAG: type II toxin-antitoxin system RelE/ParE family toxin [Terriglobia bacterium]
MPKSGARPQIVLAPAARRDIREALKWSEEKFGSRAAQRYRALLKQALRDIAADPERPGSTERAELSSGARTYHLRFSRDRARAGGAVKNPRHFCYTAATGKGRLKWRGSCTMPATWSGTCPRITRRVMANGKGRHSVDKVRAGPFQWLNDSMAQ